MQIWQLNVYTVILNYFSLIPNKFAERICTTFVVPCEKSKTILIMKNIFVFSVRSRFPLKLISCLLLLDQHQVLAIRSDLRQLACSFLWSIDNHAGSQLCIIFLIYNSFFNVIKWTVQNRIRIREYGFSLILVFSYKCKVEEFALILENNGQRQPTFYRVLCSDVLASFLLAD